MLPYLTTARGSAQQAIERLDELDARRKAREQRDREIVALSLSGQPQRAIAQALGVGPNIVSEAIDRYRRGPIMPDALISKELDSKQNQVE